jgi:hypothetical protein
VADQRDQWLPFVNDMSGAWLDAWRRWPSVPQAIADRWLKDCSGQIQSNLETWLSLARCTDPQEAVAIQQRWWQDAMARMSGGMKVYQDHVGVLSQPGAGAQPEAKPARPGSPQRPAA